MSKERLKRKEIMSYLSLSLHHSSPHLSLSYSLTYLVLALHLPELPRILENSEFMEHSKCFALMEWHRMLDTLGAPISAVHAQVPLPHQTSFTKYTAKIKLLIISRWCQHSIKPSVGHF